MDPSPVHHGPDAFSKTLDTAPRQRTLVHSQTINSKDGSVNRLSRAFQTNIHPSTNPTPAPAPTTAPSKPRLPTKPPSLRLSNDRPQSSTIIQREINVTGHYLPTTTTTTTTTTTVAKEDEEEEPLAFKDIRAKFQQKPAPEKKEKVYKKVQLVSTPNISVPPRPLPKPRLSVTRPAKEVGPRLSHLSPKGPFTTELTQCLEQPIPRPPVPTSPHSLNPKPRVISRPPDLPLGRNKALPRRTSNPAIKSTISQTTPISLVARSLTGNSTTSISTTSSNPASPSKRAWNHGTTIASWFANSTHAEDTSLKDSISIIREDSINSHSTPPQSAGGSFAGSLPISPQLSGKDDGMSKALKRSKVVHELIQTERIYQADMQLLKQVFYDQAQPPLFDKNDVKILFSNLLAILSFESDFVAKLEVACREDLSTEANDGSETSSGGPSIGEVFNDVMSSIDEIYCDYCKRHEDARCREQLEGKTMSWDLGSLLIKPVQRVLKYPLLLKELIILTPPNHPEYEDLVIATKGIQEVADHINEIKRRKDIVEKIVGDKKKTDISKITRNAQKLKQVAGFSAEPTQDAFFDSLHIKFEHQQETTRQLARDVQSWVRQVKDHFDHLQVFADSMENMYISWGGVRVRSVDRIKRFHSLVSNFSMVMSRELDVMVRGHVYVIVDDFLKTFENPGQVINKRAQKLLDYDRVRDIKSRGDTVDKTLQESADAYVSINAQLVEELPVFFRLTMTYFDILVGNLAMVQTKFYKQVSREWSKLVDRETSGNDDILRQYAASMEEVLVMLDKISPLNKDHWEAVPGVVPSEFESSISFNSRSDSHATGPRLPLDNNPRHTDGASSENEPLFRCVVISDYADENQDTLDIKKGQVLKVWHVPNEEDGWLYVSRDDCFGWVSSFYCQNL
ncbi:hypothetical protein CLU79DRAFT_832454 [Phycomyces nitens]|nr:hypothetical protein CLU79DRAFT_832454 [Phycomyces nitens]